MTTTKFDPTTFAYCQSSPTKAGVGFYGINYSWIQWLST